MLRTSFAVFGPPLANLRRQNGWLAGICLVLLVCGLFAAREIFAQATTDPSSTSVRATTDIEGELRRLTDEIRRLLTEVRVSLPGTQKGGEVHGFVSADLEDQELEDQERRALVRLPGATLYLRNLDTGNVGPTAVSDPHGWFMLARHAPGRYSLCVEAAGYTPNCDPNPIEIGGETVNRPEDARIAPIHGIVRGRVLLADGTPCYRENVLFSTLQTTTVALLSGGGARVAGPVVANSQGEYVLPEVPGPGSYVLEAVCAGANVRQGASLNSTDLSGATAVDLTLENSPPKIVSLTARLAGQAIRTAAPGDTLEVTVEAVDPDGDALSFQWGDASGPLDVPNTPTITWRLPNGQATNMLFVQVSDGRGGFALERVGVPTSQAGVVFGGRVTEAAGMPPIVDVEVSINGKAVQTNADGAFRFNVPESNRYVLNAKKLGYALLSQVFYAGTTGLDLRLQRATQQIFEPTETVTLVDRLQEDGARVTIEAGSLVDSAGIRPTGPLTGSIFTYDITQPNPIPGDESAIDRSGRDVTMVSFGAVDIDIVDGSGNQYTLAPGASAQISTPVNPTQLGAAPSTIPLLRYDEERGYWIEEGSAGLVGNRYEGTVPSFSAWNTDTVFTDAACIKITVDEARSKYPFKLRVTIPTGTGVDKIKVFPVTEKVNGLFRLPVNENIKLELLPESGPSLVLKTYNNVNSGGSVSDPFPLFPYNDCQGFDADNPPSQDVVLALDLPVNTAQWLSRKGTGSIEEASRYYAAIDPTPAAGAGTVSSNGETVTGNGTDFLSFFVPGDIIRAAGQVLTIETVVDDDTLTVFSTGDVGFNPALAAGTVYEKVGTKPTLALWRTANGFDSGGDTVAYFYNGGDLGLGREMHCKQTGAKLACYVTNYGQPGADPQTSITAAISGADPIATVAMEYGPPPTGGGGNIVTFYVFLNQTGGNRVNQALLDNEGLKNMPRICFVCHGGDYVSDTELDKGASFREFDVFSYFYDEVDGFTLGNQQEAFRRLNAMVKATGPNAANPNDPIVKLIDGLYPGGVATPGSVAVNTFVPDDWKVPPPPAGDKSALYNTIPKLYCRACHVAQSSFLDWTAFKQFEDFAGNIDAAACDAHDMPHAEVPLKNMWFSVDPHAPAFLADAATGLGFPTDCTP
jgi:hypothetical protein